MANLGRIGFELNSTASNVEVTASETTPATIQTTTVRSGAYAAQITGLVSAATKGNRYQFFATAGGGHGPFYQTVYFMYSAAPSIQNLIMAFRDTATPTDRARIYLNADGTLTLKDQPQNVIGNSSALTAGLWYKLDLKFDNSGAAGAHVLEARINDVAFATASNLTLAGGIDTLRIGGNLGNEANTAGTWYFDDWKINDSTGSNDNGYPGAGRLIAIRPNAQGDANGFATLIGGTAGAANNYTRVQEVTPDDTTSYNGSATLGLEDLFNFADPSILSTDNILAVMIGVRFRNNTADAATSMAVELEKASGGTILQSAVLTPNSTSWRTNTINPNAVRNYPIVAYTDPDGNPWTASTLNSMQAGYKITTGGTGRIDVSNVWAYIEYLPHGVITKSLQYSIKKTRSTTTKGLYYAVAAPAAVTKALKYTTKTAHAALTKSLRYGIKLTSLQQFARHFNGVDEYVDLGSPTVLPNSAAAMTATAWVYRENDNIRAIIGNCRDATTSGWRFKKSNNLQNALEFTFYTPAGGSRGWISTATIPDRQWTHVAVTFNGTQAIFYFNGVAEPNVTLGTAVTISNSADNVRIGHRVGAGSGFEMWSGGLAEVTLHDRALSGAEITAMYTSGTVPASGLKGYWKLNEPSGSTAVDQAGLNNGTYVGTTLMGSYILPAYQKALRYAIKAGSSVTKSLKYALKTTGTLSWGVLLNGTSDYLSKANTASLQVETGNKFSVSFWIYPQSYDNSVLPRLWEKRSHYMAIMGDPTNGQYRRVAIEVANASGTGNSNGGVSEFWGSTRLNLNQWYHIVGTFDGDASGTTQGKIYINGTLETMNNIFAWTGTLQDSSVSPFLIGKRNADFARNFKGGVDDMVVYQNRVLTQSEVTQLYGGTIPSGYAAYWPLNEGSGSTAYDQSANHNDLAFTGSWAGGAVLAAYQKLLRYSVRGGKQITKALKYTNKTTVSNTALEFDGVSNYAEVADNDNYSLVKAKDSFNRTVAGNPTFGTADTGGAWSALVTTTGTAVSVDGSVGSIAKTAAGSYAQTLGINIADVDLQVKGAWSVAAAGGALAAVQLIGRVADSNNYYRAELRENPGGALDIRLVKVFGGSNTIIATVTLGINYTPGTFWYLRFQINGTALKVRAWQDGTSQPTTWPIDTTDTDITAAGSVGLRVSHYTGSTAAPTVSFDNFRAQSIGMTISAWVRPAALDFGDTEGSDDQYVWILGKGTTNQHEWAMRMYNKTGGRPNRMSLYMYSLSGGLGAGAYVEEAVQIGEWIHILATVDPGDYLDLAAGVNLYKNGVFKQGTPNNSVLYSNTDYLIDPGNSTTPLRFGTRNFQSYFQGSIDHVAIWNRKLTSTEAAAVYNDNLPTAGLVGLWDFNEKTGSTLIDSANGNNATIYGATFTSGHVGRLNKQLRYGIKKAVGTSKSLYYTIRKSGAITKSMRYSMPTVTRSITKSLRYATKRSVAPVLPLKYTLLRSANNISKALAYATVTTPGAITKSMRYYFRIITYTQAKSLKYTILNVLSGPNIVPNPSFEIFTGNLFASWISSVTGSSTITPDTTPENVYDQGTAAKIAVDGASSIVVLQSAAVIPVQPNTLYMFQFYIKSDTPGLIDMSLTDTLSSGRTYLQSDKATWSTNSYRFVIATGTSYAPYTLIFKTAANQTSIAINEIKRSGSSSQANRTFWVDNVTLTGNMPLIKNLQYTILRARATSKSLRYAVDRIPGAAIKSLRYTVKRVPGAITRPLRYATKKPISTLTKPLKYATLYRPAATTKQLKYTITLTKAAITKPLRYGVKIALLTINKPLSYMIIVPNLATRPMRYAIKPPRTILKTLQYTVLVHRIKTAGLRYGIRTVPTAVSKGLRYAVKAPKNRTKQLTYEIKSTPAAIAKSMRYTMRRTLKTSKALAYEITTIGAIAKGLAYAVRRSPNICRTATYRVLTEVAITQQLQYALLQDLSINKALQYEVKTVPALNRQLQYQVKTKHDITRKLKYRVKFNGRGPAVFLTGHEGMLIGDSDREIIL